MSPGPAAVTPVRKFWGTGPSCGNGVLTSDHAVPFQCADSVASAKPSWPTAQASVGDRTVTAVPKALLCRAAGSLTKLHAVPSKCTNSIALNCWPSEYSPTAHRSPAEVPPMPLSSSEAPGPVRGFGLGTTAQAVPSKCSMSVRVAPALVVWRPTAHTLPLLTSSTPSNWAPIAPAGSGTATVLHAWPSQCSASGRLVVERA